MKKIAVVLSGCGYKDGAEITEAVSTLIALSEAGVAYQVFAPDVAAERTNHLTDQPEGQHQVLAEAGRIARGKIKSLDSLHADDFDAVVFPGGYGAAKVLCNFAELGAKCHVLPTVEKALTSFYSAQKPIGAVCIAPALVARVLGKNGITLTIGDDPDTAAEISKTGARHVNCAVTDFVTDREHRIITTPAYMYGNAQPHQVFLGIRGLIKELVEMA